MSEKTKIEWCDSTFNPVIGCTKISPACDSCYAEVSTPARAMKITWGAGEQRHRTAPSTWAQPLAWNKAHDKFFAAHGRRRRVFCASLADVFDNQWDPQWRLDLLALIMATPNLDWLLLTKRVGNVKNMLGGALDLAEANDLVPELIRWLSLWIQGEAPGNVWLGATVVNQEEADRDIPKLLAVPAHKRFLSMEPLLGPVRLNWEHIGEGAFYNSYGNYTEYRFQDFKSGCAFRDQQTKDCTHPENELGNDAECLCQFCPLVEEKYQSEDSSEENFDPTDWSEGEQPIFVRHAKRIDWVIAGGESGPGARPSHPDWYRSLRDQCAAAGVPFLFKQHGEWANSEAAALDLNTCYETSKIGGWVEPDGKVTLGEGAAPASAQASHIFKIGKKAAGRLLDCVEQNGFPT